MPNSEETKFRILKQLVTLSITSLFSCEIEDESNKRMNDLCSRYNGNQLIDLSYSKGNVTAITIKRTQVFSDEEYRFIKILAESFSKIVEIDCDEDKYLFAIARQEIIHAISIFIAEESYVVLEGVIQILLSWASQTYEGERISFSLGCKKSDDEEITLGIKFNDISNLDCAKVITSGYDTIAVCNKNGFLIGHETLYSTVEDENDYLINAPLPYIAQAKWTINNIFSIALNRNGEILIFKDGDLKLAYRRGAWIFYTHKAYQQWLGKTSKTKTSIYQTMLDISFKRTGGCIGISVDDDFSHIQSSDIFNSSEANVKTNMLKMLINGAKFYDIPRKLRQELVSIDGATVLKTNGNIITCGAILKLPGGSKTGARKAAAEELAKHGLGIKISNDGNIEIDSITNSCMKEYKIG